MQSIRKINKEKCNQSGESTGISAIQSIKIINREKCVYCNQSE